MHVIISPKNSENPNPMYIKNLKKNNIKRVYLHVIERIQPSTIWQ